MRKTVSLLLLVSLSALPLSAQVGQGEVGLHFQKGSGNAGTICPRTFQCSPADTMLTRRERVDMTVRGVYAQPYVVVIGPSTRLCVQLAGIHNSLMLPPTAVLAAGVLDEWDTIRACPGGVKRIRFNVPGNAPVGGVLVFQALAWSYLFPQGEVPTFTGAIRATIQ